MHRNKSKHYYTKRKEYDYNKNEYQYEGSDEMSIILVGGHDRMHEMYKSIGSKHGHRMKVFTQMPAKFEKVIGQPDGIVLFTSTVSHKMVKAAVKEAKKKNIPIIRCHNSSASSLESSIKELEGSVIL